jgi:hypothetical protein
MATSCGLCEALRGAPLTLCGNPGRSNVYAASAAECNSFDASAAAFDQQITAWMPTVNSSSSGGGSSSLAGPSSSISPSAIVLEFSPCRAALEVFFCAQQQVYRVDDDGKQLFGRPSACSSYRRPFRDHGQCLSFCPPIRDACPAAAHQYCEERCRADAFGALASGAYCTILEVSGLDSGVWPRSLWSEDTLDMQNLYRLEAEAEVPLLRNGRPAYRSIPARRPPGSARLTKLDYHLYATTVRGYTEWLLDTNDIDTDGATAVVSDSNLAPYRINSDWSVWSPERKEWAAVALRVTCRDGLEGQPSSAPARGGRGRFLSSAWRRSSAPYGGAGAAAGWTWGSALVTLAALATVAGPRWQRL